MGGRLVGTKVTGALFSGSRTPTSNVQFFSEHDQVGGRQRVGGRHLAILILIAIDLKHLTRIILYFQSKNIILQFTQNSGIAKKCIIYFF